MNRRTFISGVAAASVAALLPGTGKAASVALHPAEAEDNNSLYQISLSQWAYHRAIFGNARDDYSWFIKTLHSDPDAVLQGEMDPRDIVLRARAHGVDVVDPVNILWFGHGRDRTWLKVFKQKANDNGVGFGVLMCDQLGHIGDSERVQREQAIENHIRWMETAAELGCSFVRANPYGDGSYLQQCRQCAESLYRLGEASKGFDLEVLVENHGHPGSNGAWLAMLVEMTDHPRVGVFADFDNFFMGGWNLVPERRYDRYQGMLDLAPYTKAVSAKAHDFRSDGQETTIDFEQCMATVLDAGFSGLVSAEYEGHRLSENAGSEATVQLLRTVREKLG